MRTMRAALVAALLLGGCAGRDTPPDAWAFRGISQKPGELSLAEVTTDAAEQNPVGFAYGVGAILGTVAMMVVKLAAP